MSDLAWVERWRVDLNGGQTGVQLVDVDHPLEIYVGSTDMGQAHILIRSAIQPKLPRLSDLVVVERFEGREQWTLSLTLGDHRFDEVFIILANHVVERSRPRNNEQDALHAIYDVFDEWQRLLRPKPPGVLSLEELRGLVGELHLLTSRFIGELGIDGALAGWLGPLGAPQDFWYPSSGFCEAKSIGPSSSFIKITSAEQLDASPLELVVLEVPQVARGSAGAVNLIDLVADVRRTLDAGGVSHEELRVRLNRLGVDVSDPFYTETYFTVTAVQSYAVDAAFPAIRASDLPPGISAVTYRLDRTMIAPCIVSNRRS